MTHLVFPRAIRRTVHDNKGPIIRRLAGPTAHRIIGARATILEGVKGFSQYWRALFYGPQMRPISAAQPPTSHAAIANPTQVRNNAAPIALTEIDS
ncbi:hypothetical protein B7486_14670 [cyanobacterium TDX16]|nr:hypothetical protein B7486_14670 [cyanobacterium TDX16]